MTAGEMVGTPTAPPDGLGDAGRPTARRAGTARSAGVERGVVVSLRTHPTRSVSTIEAAYLLNVDPNVLRTWERSFGFPTSLAGVGQRRGFPLDEVIALRSALLSGHSIAAAVSIAQTAVGGERAPAPPPDTPPRPTPDARVRLAPASLPRRRSRLARWLRLGSTVPEPATRAERRRPAGRRQVAIDQ